MFTPGQLVLCVDDNFVGGIGIEIDPKKGIVYTVRDAYWNEHWHADHIRLEEIKNPIINYINGYHETGFSAHRFRPLNPRALDVFHKMEELV